jgi:inner membrane protein
MLKVLILVALAMLFSVALVVIDGIRGERERYRQSAIDAVAQGAARSQTLTGPVFTLDYERRVWTTDHSGARRESLAHCESVLLPDSVAIRSTVRVEERYRGIYKVQVFHSSHRITGFIRIPAHLGIKDVEEVATVEPVRLAFGVSDARGLRRPPVVRLDGVDATVSPGTHRTSLPQGFSAEVGSLRASEAGALAAAEPNRIAFDIELEVIGTDQLSFVPVGGNTHVEMASEWPHPSFSGAFLPDTRSVGPNGFQASWQLSRYATGLGDPLEPQSNAGTPSPLGQEFGVRFIQTVDVYQQNERAVKYGMLFVALTFVAFFLFEVLKRMAVHPIQYALAGAPLALFFLLLLSLAEHVTFAAAYVIASGACVGLIAFYVGNVLRSARRGLGFGALLATLYGVLYVLLQSEDYALLLGTLLLFAVLAAVMIMTRRVDWYRLGEPANGTTAG